MKIAIPKESLPGETRVAGSPDVIGKLIALGFEVVVESGAGTSANFTDQSYKDVGASIAKDFTATVKGADIVQKIQAPSIDGELPKLTKGTVLLAHMSALSRAPDMAAFAKAGLTTFAMELMPRISRAQSMDVLSSQSNLAGYRAVIDGAYELGRAFPMMMTAGGTVAPTKAFIMGAGVAGLQAIATAKRLGAVVTATDVRPDTKEQVESLGGKFLVIDPDMERDAQTEGGYAKEMPPEYFTKQKQVVAEHIKKQDLVITTALIPGRPAPTLITADMVASMNAGSVIVDMALEAGGNCEGAVADKIVVKDGVKIVGYANIASRIPENASALFAKNLFNFLSPHVDKESKTLSFDWEDDTVIGTLVTKDGAIVHERIASAADSARANSIKKPRAKPKKAASKTAEKGE
ncbi:MAG: Re/Si-specific NAD(P)(+) transhydrogenase subunit alpha [Rhodospirillales bacterium]|jgi:H+-translocating NAD(P) transhydrogenase subunit alpha|nr:Re/Si-specific NAD(P)(+) transhydrogenase subunit alpha [Rhodospirillales bacterium]MBT4039472.1 Re/Si-specific NAD(P)(+) transhydrogenase subunit alpha [Rhodospirillales bacterium]MBT4627110.1 Re/Si-specific NAD(P)(+) transhydrogenase subunit alpha [Rhodospirillales bacterium]MBT5351150.1 Re/Si-specific NAD(P)(+) transhydrogenase subunit alpha [Rhodospirillales bacterium]MBT5520454.1 Re/Si-specific NAD(P)(+) transhydrogenase subunit alpha [Rhodospirillales bacterium]